MHRSGGLLLSLLALSAGCFSPVPVSLSALAPEATHFMWAVLDVAGHFTRGELVPRAEEAPVRASETEELLVFPVLPEVLLELGLEPGQLPSRSPAYIAGVCEPTVAAAPLFELVEDRLEPSTRALPGLTSDAFRRCEGSLPGFMLNGESGLGCRPVLHEHAACEWRVQLGEECLLPPEEREWRLRLGPAETACVAPVRGPACQLEPADGRRVFVARCPRSRAVLTRPIDALEVRRVDLPGHSAPAYGLGEARPLPSGEVSLRMGYVPGLIRLSGGDLLVAVSNRLSNPEKWAQDAVTTLHRLHPDTLELRGSSPGFARLGLGLLPDRDSEETVLLPVAGTDGESLELLRVGLDGRVLETRVLARPDSKPNPERHIRFVDGHYLPEIDALLLTVLIQRGGSTGGWDRRTEVSLLDAVTLELRERVSPDLLTGESKPLQTVITDTAGARELFLLEDERDYIVSMQISERGLSPDVTRREAALGGAASLHHLQLPFADAWEGSVFVSVGQRRRSWRRIEPVTAVVQFAPHDVPTLMAPLGSGLLFGPAMDLESGDLQLNVIEPRFMDVFPTLAPPLRAVGPAGLELHDEAEGTVWFTLPWTGQLARVRLAPG